MYVTRLEVRNWRAIDELALALAPGLNVLWGPNESGKSSVREALRAAFLLPSSSRGRSTMAAARPWGRTTARPQVDVSFTHQGEEWKLRKVFFAKGSELFHNGRLVGRDDDVHARVLQTFSDVGFSVLWSVQGELGIAEVPSELRPHLAATEAVTPGVTWLQNHVQQLFDVYWTSSRGDARRPLLEARDRTYTAENLLAQLHAQLREGDRISREAEELDILRLQTVDRERSAKEDVDAAREQTVAWEAYRRQMAECQALETEARQVERWLDRWATQRSALADLRERVRVYQLDVATARETLGEEPSRAPIERLERRRLYAGARLQQIGFEELGALQAPSPEQMETLQAIENRLHALRQAREQLDVLDETRQEAAQTQAHLDALCARERELQVAIDQEREDLTKRRYDLETSIRATQTQTDRLDRGMTRWTEQRGELLDLMQHVEAYEKELEGLREELKQAEERERALGDNLQQLQQSTQEQGRAQVEEQRRLEQALTDLQRALQRWQAVQRPLADALAEHRSYQERLEATREQLAPPDRAPLDEIRQRLAFAIGRQQQLIDEQLAALAGLDRSALADLESLNETVERLGDAERQVSAILRELEQETLQERELEAQAQNEKMQEAALEAEVAAEAKTHEQHHDAATQFERGLQRWRPLRQRLLELSARLLAYRKEEALLSQEVGPSPDRADIESLQARQQYCNGRRQHALKKELELLTPPSPEQLADLEQIETHLQALETTSSAASTGLSPALLGGSALAIVAMCAVLGWALKADSVGLGAGAGLGLIIAAIFWVVGNSRGASAKKLGGQKKELEDKRTARLAELRIADLADGRRREQQANTLRAALEAGLQIDLAAVRAKVSDADALDRLSTSELTTELQSVTERLTSQEQRFADRQRACDQARQRLEQHQRANPVQLLEAALESLRELQAEYPSLTLPSPTVDKLLEESEMPLDSLEVHLETLRATRNDSSERLKLLRARHEECRIRVADLTGQQQRKSGVISTHQQRLEALTKTLQPALHLNDTNNVTGEELTDLLQHQQAETREMRDTLQDKLKVTSVDEARERLARVDALRARLLPPQERPTVVSGFEPVDLATMSLDELQSVLQSLRDQVRDVETRWREAEQNHIANRAEYDRLLQANPEKVVLRLHEQLRALVTEEPELELTGDLRDVENQDIDIRLKERIAVAKSRLDKIQQATSLEVGADGSVEAQPLKGAEEAWQTARLRQSDLRSAFEKKLRESPRSLLEKQPEQFRTLAREYNELQLDVPATLTPDWLDQLREDTVGKRVSEQLARARADLDTLLEHVRVLPSEGPPDEILTTVRAEVSTTQERLQQARGQWKAHAASLNRLLETEKLKLDPLPETPTPLDTTLLQAKTEFDEATAEHKRLLSTLGVEGLADARARDEAARDLRARLEDEPPTPEEMATLRSACDEPDTLDALDTDGLTQELATLPQRIQDAEKQWTAARNKFAEARKSFEHKLGENPETGLAAMFQQFHSLANEHAGLIGSVDEQSVENDALTEPVRVLLAEKQAEVQTRKATLRAPADSEEASQQRLKQAEESLRKAQDSREAINADLQQRLGSLEAYADLYSRVARAEEEHQRAAADQRKLEREAAVLKLLHDAIEKSRQEVETDLVGPLRERIGQRLNQITAGRYHGIKMEPDFRVETLLTAERTQAPLTDVSFGTREQMAFLSRLCLAEMLSEKERNLVVFDDNLVHTDAPRMEVACEVLREVAEKAQILLLTCHPERFAGMIEGAHVIEIERR